MGPPFTHLSGDRWTLSFGIGGANTGPPFHHHGPGWSEVIWGAKHWFLYPEGSINGPYFDPDESTYQWFLKADGYRAQLKDLYECVIFPGEVLYFPDHWKHAILNKEKYNVFVSTF